MLELPEKDYTLRHIADSRLHKEIKLLLKLTLTALLLSGELSEFLTLPIIRGISLRKMEQ